MEYESIPYALLYEENDKPAFSKISTLSVVENLIFFCVLFRVGGPSKGFFKTATFPHGQESLWLFT